MTLLGRLRAMKTSTWWAVDASTDPADKTERWAHGRFADFPYNHIPIKFQKQVTEHDFKPALILAVEALDSADKTLSEVWNQGVCAGGLKNLVFAEKAFIAEKKAAIAAELEKIESQK